MIKMYNMYFRKSTNDESKRMANSDKMICSIIILWLMICISFIIVNRDKFFTTGIYGEFDSYMLPTISIMNHGTCIIYEKDIEQAATDFPEVYQILKTRFDDKRMMVVGEGRNPFYYSVYSTACIPFKLLLDYLGKKQIYAFPMANIASLFFSFIFILVYLKKTYLQRGLLILLLSVSPISIYIKWESAEVFLFACVIITMVCFYNKWYKRAAFVLSLAGTINITLMFFGFIIIAFHFIEKYILADKNFKKMIYDKKFWTSTINLGMCFLIVFLPFVHNSYYAGVTNSTFNMITFKGIGGRFLAYLFDLNLGLFPYFPVIIILFILSSLICVFSRKYAEVLIAIGIYGVIFSYSLALHINCGMEGVSRYGAWTIPFIIFYVIITIDKIVPLKTMLVLLFIVSSIWSCAMVKILPNAYLYLNSLSEYVLDNFPALYSPLPSTFNSRINHIDGGYNYEDYLPIIYCNSDMIVTKILCSAENYEKVMGSIGGSEENMEWVGKQVKKCGDKLQYINISSKRVIMYYGKFPQYILGENISFDSFNKLNSGNNYILSGVSYCEGDFSWTDSNVVKMLMTINEDKFPIECNAKIDVLNIYNSLQTVNILVNGETVYTTILKKGFDEINFPITLNEKHLIWTIELPNAVSPKELGESEDSRKLGLELQNINIKKIK